MPAWVDQQAASGEIRASTAAIYRGRLRHWVYPHPLKGGGVLGNLPIDRVTREHLGSLILRIKAAGRSASIINGVRNPLRCFFQAQVEMRVLASNPAADLKFFVGKGAHKRSRANGVKYFKPDEASKVLAAAHSRCPRWEVFIRTALGTGLRWGELAGLYKSDLDLAKRRLHIQRTVSDSRKMEPPKNGRPRFVTLSPALMTVLVAHLHSVDREGQRQKWLPASRQLAFPTPGGHVARYSNFHSAVWRPVMAKAGIPYRSFHSTRHTYATSILEAGADIRWVQQQLGHSSIQMTVDVYGSHAIMEQSQALAKLDRLLAR